MKKKQVFRYHGGSLELPVFFPDATRAVIRTLDSNDIRESKTLGILVNTFHLYSDLGEKVLQIHNGIKGFMSWRGAVISDSGGFQVMSLAKASNKKGAVTDEGVRFKYQNGKTVYFTPEDSIRFQMMLRTDMVVVLDDFTEQGDSYEQAKETVERTILWAKRCRKEFDRLCEVYGYDEKTRPYLLAVSQGGDYLDLRKYCIEELVKIGFDGMGYGGWPIKEGGGFNYEVAELIANSCPQDYLLYGLGVGKPDDVLGCANLGFGIFDCVLPTRDARHRRLYVFNADSMEEIDIRKEKFYEYFVPGKGDYAVDSGPVSRACDCLLCTNYSRSYLGHLFRINEITAKRLATIHNLRFYSLLMEKIREERG